MKKAETVFICIGVATVFLLLVLVGSNAAILLWGHYKSSHHPLTSYQIAAYKHMSRHQIEDLLASTWDPGFIYEPWLGFREKPRRSAYVNISDLGIRYNEASDDPDKKIDGSIWFFGGSTAFGYGVADNETVPAQLEKLLKQPVTNFGRGDYSGVQENILLTAFLKSSYKPKAAIFLDGINESCDPGAGIYHSEFSRLFASVQKYNWDPLQIFKPFIQIAKDLGFKFGIKSNTEMRFYGFECAPYGRTISLADVVSANLMERREICKRYAIRCIVFVQPFAGVHGMHEDYETLPLIWRDYFLRKFNYLSPTWRRFNAVFIVDSLDSLREHAYVDNAHYSAEASGLLAKAIASHTQVGN